MPGQQEAFREKTSGVRRLRCTMAVEALMRSQSNTGEVLAGLAPVKPCDRSAEAALRARVDGKAKPPGSLGRIEHLAVRLGLIWQPRPPKVDRVTVLVFAGDHGLTAEGVSAFPA